MAVKIRLMRIGTNRQPFYRVVAVDGRKKRTGGYLELLGTYNPLTEPKEINLDQGKIDAWIKKGAVPSYGFLRIIGKAPQRAPRKAKKEKKESSAISTKQSLPVGQPSASETHKQDAGETQAAEAAPETSEEPVTEIKPETVQETASTENPEPTEEAAAEKETEIADS
ncbi:30S ribosomal protein S16 [Candidatus Daviesbacteria bacterium]|nr:30S ribosomal protein S16 [Candidatus Daviesbacteria bacterium]